MLSNNDFKLVEKTPSEGFSTCMTVSVLIHAPIEVVFNAVTDIRKNCDFFPSMEFRFDGEYPIKTGDIYFTREVGQTTWSKYRFTAVEENRCMAGELLENGGIFKRMHYNHEFIPHENGTISKETFEYKLSYGILGTLANKLYGESKAKQTLVSAHLQLKAFLEQKQLEEEKRTADTTTLPQSKSTDNEALPSSSTPERSLLIDYDTQVGSAPPLRLDSSPTTNNAAASYSPPKI